jgi:NTE family protein
VTRPFRINLALQGGGAHGAFTWGALERLLDEPEIEIAGISGTSAGALNGAAVKAGLARGSRAAARENLDWLWAQVGAVEDLRLANWLSAFGPGPGMISRMIEYSLPYSVGDAMTRVFSPYDSGPFYRNPLERIVARFRFEEVCAQAGPAFFVSATNVRSGRIRVFEGAEISPEAILASACLPTLFRAVEIADPATGRTEAYWDGGYTGNPALFPLYDRALPDDIVIVNINPLYRADLPDRVPEIMNRINEISFNSALIGELRAIHFVKRLIADGKVPKGAMKDVCLHMIADDELMNELSVATKLVPTPVVLNRLHASGKAAAARFLAEHRDSLGRRGTVDLPRMFG